MTIGLAALIAALAPAGAPAAVTPAGPWEMDNRGGCTLSRRFRSSDGQLTFGIKRYPGAEGGELVFVMPGGLTRREVGDGRLVLDQGRGSFPVVWTRVPVRGQSYHGATVQPDDGVWGAMGSATEMTVDIGDHRKVRLAVGPMTNAMAALDECRKAKIAVR